VTEGQLEQATVRAAAEARTASRAGAAIAYLGAIVFPDDELVLCLFDAGSRAAVRRTTELAAIPCERVMHSHWLPCHPPAITGREDGQRPPTAQEARDATHLPTALERRTPPMTASTPRRMLVAALAIAVLGLLALAGASHGAAETGTFQFQTTETDPIDLTATCLGPGATGTITSTDTVVGRFTENGPPAFGFHDHGTSTSTIRVDLADGRYIVGSLVAHFDDDATHASQLTSTQITRGQATLYAPDGQPLGPVTVHAASHLSWRDANGDHAPDPDEFTANVDDLRLTCL
jgi:hypothetical protein